MILPPKSEPVQFKVRLSPDLIEEVKVLAERTGRSITETTELLLRWAVERAQHELDLRDRDEQVSGATQGPQKVRQKP